MIPYDKLVEKKFKKFLGEHRARLINLGGLNNVTPKQANELIEGTKE